MNELSVFVAKGWRGLCLWRGRRKSFVTKVRGFPLTCLSIVSVSFGQARYSRENLVLKLISTNQKGNWLS